MSAVIKASALPVIVNLLGIFGVAYQVGNFRGEIAAKVAALEATDLRHDRQLEALQKYAVKPSASKVVKDSNPFDTVFIEDRCADIVR